MQPHIIFLLLFFIIINIMLVKYGAGKNHYKWAAWEVLIIWIISNAPLFWLAFTLLSNDSNSNYIEIIKTNIKAGEIFIYIAAIFAPVIYNWCATLDKQYRTWHIIIFVSIILCFMVSSYYYASYKLNNALDSDFVNQVSFTIYVTAIITWFGMVAFKRRLNSVGTISNNSNNIINDLKEHE